VPRQSSGLCCGDCWGSKGDCLLLTWVGYRYWCLGGPQGWASVLAKCLQVTAFISPVLCADGQTVRTGMLCLPRVWGWVASPYLCWMLVPRQSWGLGCGAWQGSVSAVLLQAPPPPPGSRSRTPRNHPIPSSAILFRSSTLRQYDVLVAKR